MKKGRPKKAVADRRTNMLRVRLTNEEREKLDKAAAGKSLDTSSWARSVLLSNQDS